MFNVCPNCGLYQVDKEIVEENGQSFAICSNCQYAHPFLKLPSYCLTGASGAGKSTLGYALIKNLQDYVILDKDILWSDAFNTPETNFNEFNELWLRMAKNIHQSGRSTIICGTTLPQHLNDSIEKRYFSNIHFLALLCSQDELAKRLRARPKWRGFNEEVITEHLSFNQWIKDNAQERGMDLLDTSNKTVEECVDEVREWLNKDNFE